ncbi:hypothetical protein AAEX28_03070 [Lentisphaerota bacterium WC36G]|nr:hypothetical protein LJT99_05950 [Lentisphaerae bacterium WC36]
MKKKKSPREKLTCHNMPEDVMKDRQHFKDIKMTHIKYENHCGMRDKSKPHSH